MMVKFCLLFASLLAFVVRGEDTDLALEHSLDEGVSWSSRGSVKLSVDMVKKKISLKFSSSVLELTDSETAAFKSLMSSNSLYRVRIPQVGLSASIPSCQLAGNKFREAFRFHIDKSGALSSFDYQPPADLRDCNTAGLDKIKLLSKSSASLPLDAHAIPKDAVATGNLQAATGSGDEKEAAMAASKGDQQDSEEEKPQEQSFIRKYWYVLLPIAIMSMFGGVEEPQQGAAGAAPPAAGAAKKKK